MLLNRIKKYVRLLQYILFLNLIKRNSEITSIRKIGILASVNPKSPKFKFWHDGFTEAVKKLSKDFEVTMIFFGGNQPNQVLNEINQQDLIIVKSAWRTPMDYFIRKNSKSIKPLLGLMISASKHGPSQKEQAFYDVVWYETYWYKNRSIKHRNAFHAFGIDTTVMQPIESKKIYDYITVGAPRKYKRLYYLLKKSGKRLLIGDQLNKDSKSEELIDKLIMDGVRVEDFIDYPTLARKYNQSITCYVPCSLHGGGERSVLEARACGLIVEIEDNNQKLKELLESPIWDADYYARQLKLGIQSLI